MITDTQFARNLTKALPYKDEITYVLTKELRLSELGIM